MTTMIIKTNNEKEITCPSGKVGYKSKGKAEAAIRTINNNNSGDRLRAYYCKECGEWHLTSSHVIESRMLRKSFAQYNRLEKKAQDKMILQINGLA